MVSQLNRTVTASQGYLICLYSLQGNNWEERLVSGVLTKLGSSRLQLC